MSGEWKAKRFWDHADVRRTEGGGWEVMLDSRVLRTPGGQPLVLPTEALARAVAAEWDAQEGVIAPHTMALTRAVNSAVERVAPQHADVAAMLAEYGGTDLLCYRADHPELAARQAAEWQPLLDWAQDRYGALLAHTTGVAPIPQDPDALAALSAEVARLDHFRLTALHDLVTLPGSLVLGLAVLDGRLSAAEAHRLARLDEDFQAEAWGRDEEAEAAAQARAEAMEASARLLEALTKG